jgi:hypothetical protein
VKLLKRNGSLAIELEKTNEWSCYHFSLILSVWLYYRPLMIIHEFIEFQDLLICVGILKNTACEAWERLQLWVSNTWICYTSYASS